MEGSLSFGRGKQQDRHKEKCPSKRTLPYRCGIFILPHHTQMSGSIDGFVAYSKATPGKLNVAQIGTTGIHQAMSLQLMKKLGSRSGCRGVFLLPRIRADNGNKPARQREFVHAVINIPICSIIPSAVCFFVRLCRAADPVRRQATLYSMEDTYDTTLSWRTGDLPFAHRRGVGP